ncbi:MAG: alpha/beta hydrolase [Lentisphaerae bacterium]|nr:alpha/beta hydrolase [Lentisphaerota bacterium]
MQAGKFRNIVGVAVVGLLSVVFPPSAFPAEKLPGPETILLWPDRAPVGDGAFAATNTVITVYRPAQTNGAAIVVCPGGGYAVWGPAEMEGRGTAEWLSRNGFVAAVLRYRLPQGCPFVPLLDAQRAIRTIRAHAGEWGCDPARIGILGFSAGGHVASTAGTHFDDGDPGATDPVGRIGCRPDFMVLIYPVITMGAKTHGLSKRNLLGPNPTAERVELFSNEKQVTDRTPPAFLAHARDDDRVLPENSRLFYEALQARHVPSQYLELPRGNHGLYDRQGPMWEAWKSEVLKWLAAQGMMPEHP